MGGQACVLYGAVDFSRDVDIVLLVEPENVRRLDAALAELQARRIAVPPYELEYLLRGHAVHFRCAHPEADDVRLDVMCKMRGVADFEQLWARRFTFQYESGPVLEVMSIADLVDAKKTRRDKDWLMIRALVQTHYLRYRDEPSPERIDFWLRQSRTASTLVAITNANPQRAGELVAVRPLLSHACQGSEADLEAALIDEENRERQIDESYWRPLLKELEDLRHRKRHDDPARP
jgi:hypothetical protein